eukprot:9070068-Alexandrium_andersonii.AAC.1
MSRLALLSGFGGWLLDGALGKQGAVGEGCWCGAASAGETLHPALRLLVCNGHAQHCAYCSKGRGAVLVIDDRRRVRGRYCCGRNGFLSGNANAMVGFVCLKSPGGEFAG